MNKCRHFGGIYSRLAANRELVNYEMECDSQTFARLSRSVMAPD